MMQLLVSTPTGAKRQIGIQPGETLAQAIYLSGEFALKPLCSGLGHCGLCRVQFLSAPPPALPEDEAILGPEAVQSGWRLGCKHKAADGSQVRVSVEPSAAGNAGQPKANAESTARKVYLAVDLGTTSLAWSALAAQKQSGPEAARICAGQELNPQIGAGSDVLSRLAEATAPGGETRLQALTLQALRRIVAAVPGCVEEICLAGNPAMLALTRGASVLGLASAPYSLEFRGNSREVLPGLPPIYFPPQVSAYIGADISAGMTAVLQENPAYPFILADLGTNGEFVLALSAKRSLAVSVPLGPALEGIGMSHGALAGVGGASGVITAFSAAPQGLQPMAENGQGASGAKAAAYSGISGTGYLSLLHQLRKLNILSEDGRFNADGLQPLARKITSGLHSRNGQLELDLPGRLSLTGTDIEEVLKVKAAFSLALDTLLEAAEMSPGELKSCYLAGALGLHINLEDIYALGFLPESLPGKHVRILGNAALRGAELLLLSPQTRELALGWAKACTTLNLTADKAFMTRFLRHMRFSFPRQAEHA